MALLETALTGGRRYWAWVATLVAFVAIGVVAWLHQLDVGLAVTGLGRDVTWGLYIAQFTFLVGVAASAVMVVLPCYLHDCRAFARVTILGELVAIAAVTMCALFILVDMGQPSRVLKVLLYPTPGSMMFWDMVSLCGYLLLNAVIATVTLRAERHETPVPRWIRPVILLSIPWAVSIHTVTAFLYSGLPGRPFWLTAVLAPRFLASAFAAGPALLILLALLLRRAGFDAGRDAIRTLALIVVYAMVANVFFLLVELFTAFYSGIPEHAESFRYLFAGLDGHHAMVPWMWTSALLTVGSLALLLVPRLRANERLLALAATAVFVALWIDKGLGLIVGGLVPSPLGAVVDYTPTGTELAITVGIWAIGALMVTVFVKMVIAVRSETFGPSPFDRLTAP
jgi:molybdopterin-containing oxidoreductase family membrane subunit